MGFVPVRQVRALLSEAIKEGREHEQLLTGEAEEKAKLLAASVALLQVMVS